MTAWALETNAGKRHPLDVVARGSVQPALRARGFERRGRTWNRRPPHTEVVHVVNLQASKYNVLTSLSPVIFYVNVGVFLPDLHRAVYGQAAPEWVKEYQCQIRRRLDTLTGQRAQLMMTFEPDLSLEQQGEQLARWIVEFGVGFLDRAESLASLWSSLSAELAEEPGGDVSFVRAYLAARAGERDEASRALGRAAEQIGADRVWRPRLERVAELLAIDVPPARQAKPVVPTLAAFREGGQRLDRAVLPDAELAPDWQRTSSSSGFSAWPNLTHTFRGSTPETASCQLQLHLSHFADAQAAQAMLPRLPEALILDGPRGRAARRQLGVGPVAGFVEVSGGLPDGQLDLLANALAERQQARLRATLDEQAVLDIADPSAAEVEAVTAHVTPATTRGAISSPAAPAGRTSALRLELADCAALRDERDVKSTIERIAGLGLVPSLGPWAAGHTPTLIGDVEGWMRQVHHQSEVWKRQKDTRRKLSRTSGSEHWMSAALGRGMGWSTASLAVGRYGRDNWHVTVWVYEHGTSASGLSLEDFVTGWSNLLVRIAEELRPVLRPALALIFASSSYIESVEDMERGALLVGWRTWYGPPQVERFGQQFLLGLPDRTELLPDGTIAHALELSPVELVGRRSGKYARLRAYLRQAPVHVGWPRL